MTPSLPAGKSLAGYFVTFNAIFKSSFVHSYKMSHHTQGPKDVLECGAVCRLCHNTSKTHGHEQNKLNKKLFFSHPSVICERVHCCLTLAPASDVEDVIITMFEWQPSSTNLCTTFSADPESAACPQKKPHRDPLPLLQLSHAWVELGVCVRACVSVLGYIYPLYSVRSAECTPSVGSDFLSVSLPSP